MHPLTVSPLPSLRRRIFTNVLSLVALYGALGVLLIFAVFVASRNTPRVLHRNYDSISAMRKADEGLDALRRPLDHPQKTQIEWVEQVEREVLFEKNNVTEEGEKEAAETLFNWWEKNKSSVSEVDADEWGRVKFKIISIVNLNEKGMFRQTASNSKMANMVLVLGVLGLLCTLVVSVILGDRISNRLSTPIRNLAEILRSKPKIGKKLRLPEPLDLELLILNQELMRLWDQVNEVENLNVKQIYEEKKRLETVLDSVEDSLIVVDHSGRVTHCNKFLMELIGLKEEQIIGHFWKDLSTNDEDYLKLREVLDETLRNGAEIEFEIGHERLHYAARSRKIEDELGKPVGILYLLHDITEKRQRDKLRNDVVDLLSHELKTPLQSLSTASDILVRRKADLPEDLKILSETIAEDIQRMNAVSHEFVQVSHGQSKVMKFKIEKVLISEALQDWLKPFRVVAHERGIELSFENISDKRVYAFIDPVKFPWVISNLISNAIRFSPKGEAIVVRLEEKASHIEITVKDFGPGIPRSDRDKVFEPFYQTKIPTNDGSKGLFGVGLTIAKDVVEAHDGTLQFIQNTPTGSIFKIVLPTPNQNLG